MNVFFEAPLTQLSHKDIAALVAQKTRENHRLEYKRDIPSESNNSNDSRSLDRYARGKLSSTVVAFANAQGGVLILGVGESRTESSEAADCIGIPNYGSVADQLRDFLSTNIEPALPVEIASIPVEKDLENRGYVVIRVQPSARSPHAVRSRKSLKFYIRRGSKTDSMNVYEVQDMAVRSMEWRERFEERLTRQTPVFHEAFNKVLTPDNAFGFCMTALPVIDTVNINPVYSNNSLVEDIDKPSIEIRFSAQEGSGGPLVSIDNRFKGQRWRWRPIIRGARAEKKVSHGLPRQQPPGHYAYQEIHSDGTIQMAYISLVKFPDVYEYSTLVGVLRESMPLVMLAELAHWAKAFSARAGVPNTEYVIEARFRVAGNCNSGNQAWLESAAYYPREQPRLPCLAEGTEDFVMPRYFLSESGISKIENLLDQFSIDLWNWLQLDISALQRTYKIRSIP